MRLSTRTHDVAAAIAAGVTEVRPDAQVQPMRVSEADPERAAAADLRIVGGPTHMSGMAIGLSRRMCVSAEEEKDPEKHHDLEPGAEGPGVRDWFHRLPKPTGGRPRPRWTHASAPRWS